MEKDWRVKLIWFLAYVSLASQGFGKPAAQCYGPKKAPKQVVYLHGLDTVKPSLQELNNREILRKLADKSNFRLAILRSSDTCRGKLCWPNKTPAEHKTTFSGIRDSMASCFNVDAPVAFIGFSNGGYFASKIIQYCIRPNSWVLAVGSAGSWQHSRHAKTTTCGQLSLLIGEHDITKSKALRYYGYLKKAGFRVDFSTFAGGHELKLRPVEKALQSFLSQ